MNKRLFLFLILTLSNALMLWLFLRTSNRVEGAAPEPASNLALLPPVSINRADFLGEDLHAPDYTGCGGTNAPVVNADYEQQVLDLVNTERANRGLAPLKRVIELDRPARYHSTDLGQDNYFYHDSHDRIGGNLQWVCSWSTRISNYYSNWRNLAENIAAGYTTPSDAMAGWMASDGHRANILSTSSWEIGVGYYQGSGNYYRYWTQDFGRRSNVYPLIINRDAASTDTRSVSIFIYGSWQEMRLRNDNGAWSGWQPFSNSFGWTLANGVGDHGVTAELHTSSANATSSDSIYLTVADPPVLGGVPDSLTFLYSIPGQAIYPASHMVTPINTNGTEILTWSLSSSGGWFDVSPPLGSTPQPFAVFPTDFVTDTVNTYSGIVTVTVTSPAGVLGSPHPIQLTLEVTDSLIYQFFIPVVNR